MDCNIPPWMQIYFLCWESMDGPFFSAIGWLTSKNDAGCVYIFSLQLVLCFLMLSADACEVLEMLQRPATL